MLNNIKVELNNDYTNAEAIALLLCKECVAGIGKLGLPAAAEQAVSLYLTGQKDIFGCGEVRQLTAIVPYSASEAGADKAEAANAVGAAGTAKLLHILIVGCGEGSECKPNNFRKAAGAAVRALRSLKVANAAVAAPILMNASRAHYLQAVCEGLYLGAYTFTEFQPKTKAVPCLNIGLVSGVDQAEAALSKARAMAKGVTLTRNLVNRPGNVVNPQVMAEEAAKVAAEYNLDCTILDEEQMAAKKMQALLAVGQGSAAESRLICLKYNGAGSAPYTAYVGKGITFDSGGISIKPDDNMGEMKDDMAGAGAVLGAMQAIAEMQLPVNIMAVLACAENMPGGKAQRPGDIVTAANGKTIEVVSTDAEGRMVLADAVWYACREGAAKVVDIATLTGAVIVALGKETSGIVSNNDALVEAIKAAGKRAGESWWQLPSLPECKEALKSDVADLLNSAGRAGGCITGGLFIGEFVDDGLPWAHLDIGGTSTSEKTSGHIVKGGSGFGCMTLVRLAEASVEA